MKYSWFLLTISCLLLQISQCYGQELGKQVEGVPKALLLPELNLKALQTPVVAEGWTAVYLNPQFLPPRTAKAVLRIRRPTDCDMTRISYDIGDFVITVSQTISVIAVQFDWAKPNRTKPLTVSEVQSLAHVVFKDGENLELAMSPGIAADAVRKRGKVEVAKNLPWHPVNDLAWWMQDKSAGFYAVKNDGFPSARFQSDALRANAFWFSPPNTDQLSTLKEAHEYPFSQLISPKVSQRIIEAKEEANHWLNQTLRKPYLAPDGLTYAILPGYSTANIAEVTPTEGHPNSPGADVDRLLVSYRTDQGLISLTQTKSLFAIQLEKPQSEARTLMTPPQILAQVQKLLNGAENLSLKGANITPQWASGMMTTEQPRQDPWLKQLYWWADSKQIILYFPKDTTISMSSLLLNGNNQENWYSSKG